MKKITYFLDLKQIMKLCQINTFTISNIWEDVPCQIAENHEDLQPSTHLWQKFGWIVVLLQEIIYITWFPGMNQHFEHTSSILNATQISTFLAQKSRQTLAVAKDFALQVILAMVHCSLSSCAVCREALGEFSTIIVEIFCVFYNDIRATM